MINKIKQIILNNYFLFFDIYMISLFMDLSSFNYDYPTFAIISKLARFMTYAYFLIRLWVIIPNYIENIKENLKTDSSFKKLLFLIIVLITSIVINFIIFNDRRLVIACVILFASYGVNYKKILKHICTIQLIMSLIFIVCAISGLTQNYIIHRGNIARNSLGYAYPTVLPQMMLFSSLIYSCLLEWKVSYKEILLFQMLNISTYYLSNSRTEFLFLEGLIIVLLLYKLFPKLFINNQERIQKILKNITDIFPVFPILMLVITMLYRSGDIFVRLNKALSNRLHQTFMNFQVHGFSWFGNDVKLLGNGLETKLKYGSYRSNYIDSEYIQVLFQRGVIIGIAFVIILYILIRMLYKNKKYSELILCLVYLFFGLINPRIINFAFSPVLFLIIPAVHEYYENLRSGKDGKVN